MKKYNYLAINDFLCISIRYSKLVSNNKSVCQPKRPVGHGAGTTMQCFTTQAPANKISYIYLSSF